MPSPIQALLTLADKVGQYSQSIVAKDIYRHIIKDEIHLAKILYGNDGDKVTQYVGLREAIEACLGLQTSWKLQLS